MTAALGYQKTDTNCNKVSTRLTANGYPTFIFTGALTHEQVCFFKVNGFIHFKHFINKTDVELAISELANIQRYLISNNITKVNGVPLKFGLDENGEKMLQRFAFTSHYSPAIQKLISHEKFSLLTQLLGDNARIGLNEKDGLVVNHYLNNVGSSFTEMGWHTDSIRDLFYGLKINPLLNVGIHLDDTNGNGGLKLLPGTHLQSLWSMLFRKKYFLNKNTDKQEVSVDVEAGDLTIHDGRIWHRMQSSKKTGAESRRRVMYFPIITGPYQPKNENSPTPLYQRFYNKVLK